MAFSFTNFIKRIFTKNSAVPDRSGDSPQPGGERQNTPVDVIDLTRVPLPATSVKPDSNTSGVRKVTLPGPKADGDGSSTEGKHISSREIAESTSDGEAPPKTVTLSVAHLLKDVSENALGFGSEHIPDHVETRLPLDEIRPQLAKGKVTVPLGMIIEGCQERYRPAFTRSDKTHMILLPLAELFRQFPASQKKEDPIPDQEPIETPFSTKAAEDARAGLVGTPPLPIAASLPGQQQQTIKPLVPPQKTDTGSKPADAEKKPAPPVDKRPGKIPEPKIPPTPVAEDPPIKEVPQKPGELTPAPETHPKTVTPKIQPRIPDPKPSFQATSKLSAEKTPIPAAEPISPKQAQAEAQETKTPKPSITPEAKPDPISEKSALANPSVPETQPKAPETTTPEPPKKAETAVEKTSPPVLQAKTTSPETQPKAPEATTPEPPKKAETAVEKTSPPVLQAKTTSPETRPKAPEATTPEPPKKAETAVEKASPPVPQVKPTPPTPAPVPPVKAAPPEKTPVSDKDTGAEKSSKKEPANPVPAETSTPPKATLDGQKITVTDLLEGLKKTGGSHASQLVENPDRISEKLPTIKPPNYASRDVSPHQIVLRALFSSAETFDTQTVVNHCRSLPGITSCLFSSKEKTIADSAGELPSRAEEIYQHALALAHATGVSGDNMFTIRTNDGLMSFFTEKNCCLGVSHEGSAFQPGVCEKLMLVTRELAAMA